MFEVILELLSTNGADNMICSWFWLFDALRMLFHLGLLQLHLLDVVVILLVQELHVLIRKFPFLLELEDGCSEGSFEIEGWDVVFTNVNRLA
jgi:hypothetical protein